VLFCWSTVLERPTNFREQRQMFILCSSAPPTALVEQLGRGRHRSYDRRSSASVSHMIGTRRGSRGPRASERKGRSNSSRLLRSAGRARLPGHGRAGIACADRPGVGARRGAGLRRPRAAGARRWMRLDWQVSGRSGSAPSVGRSARSRVLQPSARRQEQRRI